MAKFIKLTISRNGKPIYLNVDKIVSFRDYIKTEAKAKTMMETDSSEKTIYLLESVEEVERLIKQA